MQAYEKTNARGMLQPLTVGDLLDILRDQPRSSLVVLASDAEVNDTHPLMTVGVDVRYDAEAPFDRISEDGRGRRATLLVPMD